MAAYPSLQVASLIANICNQKGYHWNNTKIQKLLYCCYGCFLAAFSERLCDEYPRAWQYGPVFPKVFNHIHKQRPFPVVPLNIHLPPEKNTFLEEVVSVFGSYNAVPLSDWTHRPGSPWYTVVHEIGNGELGDFIPDDIIKTYFSENIVKESNDETPDN
ncbi:MAG: DUF4065 domain-containing protein [Desulfovibrio sp.]|jgi:uncharacterized phage-associated protein|nr:DUF4065 domain-containing protein [Desulfovibrio sp.]